VAIALAQEMAFRLESMADKAGALALQSVRQRLAAFLIAEADKAESGSGISWTRDEMARQIGTVRDVIGRNLRGLEEEGIIRRKKGDILLLDKEGLLRIARGADAT
jgi:CRP/FNR family transcriptional regulator